MAATVEARRLTESHRLAQARIGARTATQLLASWQILDLVDLDRTTERWLRVVLPIVTVNRRESARLAATYLQTFRTLETGSLAGFAAVLADEIDRAAVSTSLVVTGPVYVKAAMTRGLTLEEASVTARVAAARAALRHSLGGSRDTIIRSISADRQALGWARATSADPCHFCAMLASRGPVYRSEADAAFEPHDGCHCQPEAVYNADAAWPPGSDQYRELWDSATEGLSGQDAIRAFRRAFESR
jgi:hypothetical protein